MFKILGRDDSVSACDCCGKSNLKSTVIVEVDGEILHYGSVCATRHTGMKSSEIKNAIENEYLDRLAMAMNKWRKTPEYLAEEAAHAAARKAGLIGQAFRDSINDAHQAAGIKAAEIMKEYRIRALS